MSKTSFKRDKFSRSDLTKSSKKQGKPGVSQTLSFFDRVKSIVKNTKRENLYGSSRLSSNAGSSMLRNSHSDTYLHLTENQKYLKQIDKQEQTIRELHQQNKSMYELSESVNSIKEIFKRNHQFFIIFGIIATILFLTFFAIIPILIQKVSSLADEIDVLVKKLSNNINEIHSAKNKTS